MDDIALSHGVRRSLLAMQQTVAMLDRTNNRIATGKKVNTALDNPTSYFIASSLESRAGDLSRLLDSVTIGIKTLEATDQGIKGLKNLVETAQATARQALIDPSGGTPSLTTMLSGLNAASTFGPAGFRNGDNISITYGIGAGAVTQAIPVNRGPAVLTGTADVTSWVKPGSMHQIVFQVGTNPPVSVAVFGGESASTIAANINAQNAGVTASIVNGRFTMTSNQSLQIDLAQTESAILNGLGFSGANNTDVAATATSVQDVLDAINNSGTLNPGLPVNPPRVQASLAGGRLHIESLGLEQISLSSSNGTALSNLFGSTTTALGTLSQSRVTLARQFETLKEQMTELVKDTSYNGINLLKGDQFRVLFNEVNSTFLDINGVVLDAVGLGFAPIVAGRSADTASRWQSDAEVEGALIKLNDALAKLRSQASVFGAHLSVLQTREDFTRQSVLSLNGGANILTAADNNEEGAHLLSLQTRQQLSTQALGMTAQMDQAVLRLFA